MALNTEKQIKSIFYNSTEIPLAGGSSSSSETTSVTFQTDPQNAELWISVLYQTGNNEYKFNNDYLSTESFTLQNVLIGGIIFMYIEPSQEYSIFSSTSENIEEVIVSYGGSADLTNTFSVWKVTGKSATILYRVSAN